MTAPFDESHTLKIAIVGTSYAESSNAVLLAQHNEVVAIDIVPAKVAMLKVYSRDLFGQD